MNKIWVFHPKGTIIKGEFVNYCQSVLLIFCTDEISEEECAEQVLDAAEKQVKYLKAQKHSI